MRAISPKARSFESCQRFCPMGPLCGSILCRTAAQVPDFCHNPTISPSLVQRLQRLEAHSMRIAQIAPLFEAVPPKLYGGTERVVSNLTEELVAMGHDVTLFATGDSVTAAKLEAVRPQ